MSFLERAYADGQLVALRRHKLAWPAATSPVVQQSAILKSQPSPSRVPVPPPASTPQALSETFDRHEQDETRMEPRRKLSSDTCGTCRKAKHYGPCSRPIPIKKADFNFGMTADDAEADCPSTRPHYSSATTADSSLARARDGRPADEQASSAFADLFRHLGVTSVADEPGRMTAGLDKVSGLIPPSAEAHSLYERRGPSPYEERVMTKSPPIAWGDEGAQRVERAFDGIDAATDSTCVESVAP